MISFVLSRKVLTVKDTFVKRLYLLKNRFQLPEKWKGGRIEEWGNFWKNLFLDYKTVASDAIEEAKTKPHKAVLIASGLATMFGALKTNPDAQSFDDHLIQCTTELSMVGDPIRNPASEEHVKYIIRCQNQGLLRKTDLIFFSLIWIADYDKDCKIYATQCKYLQPRYLTFYQRIIDIGIFNTWLNMRWKMRDYDINPTEWPEAS